VLPPDLLPDHKRLGGAAQWFANVLPRCKDKHWKGPKLTEVLQKPGETIFVPAGWWHAVLNLDITVAVTQNFAEPRNFPRVWDAVAAGRGDLISIFYDRLREKYPDLADEADSMGGVAAVRENLGIGDLFASFLECDPGNVDDSSEDEGLVEAEGTVQAAGNGRSGVS